MDNSSYNDTSVGGGASVPLTEQAKQQAQKVVEQTQRKTGAALEQARDQVRSRVTTQKDQAASGLDSVALAVRQASQHLREQQQDMLGGYAESAAEAVESFSGYLRRTDVDAAVAEVERFARSQPVLFLGSAFALGFLAARFFKSSGQSSGAPAMGTNGIPAAAMGATDPLLPVPVYDDPTGAGDDAALLAAEADTGAAFTEGGGMVSEDEQTSEMRTIDDAAAASTPAS